MPLVRRRRTYWAIDDQLSELSRSLAYGLSPVFHFQHFQTPERKIRNMAFSQDDLAVSLARYINPDHEEFDLDFTIEIMRLRSDWFSDEERERVANWVKAKREDPEKK